VSILDVWGVRGSTKYLGAEYTILVTDANLNVLGDPITRWVSLQVTLRWKEPGSGQFEVPAHPEIRELLQPGCRIVIIRRLWDMQHTLIAGPMEGYLRERADDGDNGGVGKLTVTFVEDMAWLGARIAYPNPALTPATQTTDFWTYTGNPVTAMENLVYNQAGFGALAVRRVPKLAVNTPSPPVVGYANVTVKSRLEKLTDVLRTICTLGNGAGFHPDSLGFRTRQVGSEIYFEAFRSRDLTGQVHFSFGAGNLKYYSLEVKAPQVTHPHVGGQGEGADRFFDVYPTLDAGNLAWGRFESYEPYAGNAPVTELKDQATRALAEQGQNARLASNAADTPDQRFGVHYNVGDIVSLELDIGEFVTAPVQTINVQAFPTAGEVAGITIGDQGARYDSDWIRKMRLIDRRVGDLERVVQPAASV
jgi:ReqiPepy6 Gp37-like protein